MLIISDIYKNQRSRQTSDLAVQVSLVLGPYIEAAVEDWKLEL